jgi:hypothetical protein
MFQIGGAALRGPVASINSWKAGANAADDPRNSARYAVLEDKATECLGRRKLIVRRCRPRCEPGKIGCRNTCVAENTDIVGFRPDCVALKPPEHI